MILLKNIYPLSFDYFSFQKYKSAYTLIFDYFFHMLNA